MICIFKLQGYDIQVTKHTPIKTDPALIRRRTQPNSTLEPSQRWSRMSPSSSPTKKTPQRRSRTVQKNSEPNRTQNAPFSSSTMTQPLTNPPHLLSFPRLQCPLYSIPISQSSNAPFLPLGFPLTNSPVNLLHSIKCYSMHFPYFNFSITRFQWI